tara:strand:- start:464 stop:850 length:387 start_codon:yes stop_codon:yes gene_type:complete
MEFLDLVKIGSTVKINVNLSKDRLTSKTLNAINVSSNCVVKDFRLTDGKGIGVIVELSNGEKEWFFENEIEIIDNDGNILEREYNSEKNLFLSNFFNKFQYRQSDKIRDLINPINFFSWLIYSLKDIF